MPFPSARPGWRRVDPPPLTPIAARQDWRCRNAARAAHRKRRGEAAAGTGRGSTATSITAAIPRAGTHPVRAALRASAKPPQPAPDPPSRPYSAACRSQLLVAAVLAGAVMCPTCLCGAGWPRALMLSADHSLNPIASRVARDQSAGSVTSGRVNRNVVPSAALSSTRI